jgi:hypothetical protein
MKYRELHETQEAVAELTSFGRVELTPVRDADLGLCSEIRSVAQTWLHPDVARDFGDAVVERYSQLSAEDIRKRFKKLGRVTGQELYAVSVEAETGRLIGAGIASITPCIPRIKFPTEEQAEMLARLVPSFGDEPSALVATYWLGIEGIEPRAPETVQTRHNIGLYVARPLVARVAAVASANGMAAVSFEVPLDSADATSPSSAMREVMTASGLTACWTEPPANDQIAYELLVA